MKESKEKLKRELEILATQNTTNDAYLVGDDFFFGESKSKKLTPDNIDSLLSVFIGSVDILFENIKINNKNKRNYAEDAKRWKTISFLEKEIQKNLRQSLLSVFIGSVDIRLII